MASVCEPIEVCFKFLPCSKASPCLIVPAHNEAKIVCRFAASPCLKKNSANFIFFGKNVKPCLTSRLPLGGKLSTSLTDEERPLLRTAFLYPVFSIAKHQKLSALFQGFPLASSCLRTMRQKSSDASRLPLASSCLRTMRQKCEALPYVKASPRGEAPCEARW